MKTLDKVMISLSKLSEPQLFKLYIMYTISDNHLIDFENIFSFCSIPPSRCNIIQTSTKYELDILQKQQ